MNQRYLKKQQGKKTRSLRLLFVSEFYGEQDTYTGGVEARLGHIVKQLCKSHEVHVVSRKTTLVSASVSSLPARLWFQMSSIGRGLGFKAEVVEGSNFVSYLPAFVIARLHRAKAVAWVADLYGHTWFSMMSFPVAVAGFIMEWLAFRLPFDGYIAMSEATKKKLVDAGIRPEKIEVIYGGVSSPTISLSHPKKLSHVGIFTAARLVNYKRIDTLIKAMPLVSKKHPDVELYIAGDGPEKQELVDLSCRLGISDRVHFLGTISQLNVSMWMQQTHVFCLPSAVEGFGLVTIEAMAAGLPYVNSDIRVTREVTHNGKGGMLFELGSFHDLAKNINRLLSDKKLYEQKRQEGLKLSQSYNWEHIGRQTEAYYRHLLTQQ